MINAIYFLSEFLFTYVKCWMSFELIAVLSEHKVEKKSENIVKIISSLGASVLYVYNSTIISTLFSSVMMILVVFILVIISGIIYVFVVITNPPFTTGDVFFASSKSTLYSFGIYRVKRNSVSVFSSFSPTKPCPLLNSMLS